MGSAGSPVSEKNSSRKLADQARLPTPRYCIGMRAYESGFPRMSLLGDSVNKGNPAPRHWLSLICWREIPEKRIIKLVSASSLEALREGQPRREAGERKATGLHNGRRPGYRIASSRALIERVPWRKGGEVDAS